MIPDPKSVISGLHGPLFIHVPDGELLLREMESNGLGLLRLKVYSGEIL